MPKIEISIIICCYNSESRIVATLESLLAQQLDPDVSWEVVLVDNNCSDQTIAVARNAWTRSDVVLKVVEESEAGLSAARECGVRHSSGTFILYCDDDNWLAPDYLKGAFDFMAENPDYAAIGGWGDVVSDEEVVIPDWFKRFETKYACGKTNAEGDVDTLVGAGMFLRKDALLNLQQSGFKSLLSDRKGTALSSGGDLELGLALRLVGWKLYFSEDLYFKHYMPAGRLTEDYLVRMCHGHALSRPVIGEYFRLLALKEGRSHWLHKIVPFFVLAVWRLLRSSVRVFGKRASDDLASSVDFAIESATNEQYRISLLSGQAFGLRKRVKQNVGL